MRVPASFGEVFGASLFPGLPSANFSSYLLMAETGLAGSGLFLKGTNLTDKGSTLMT